MPFLLFGTSRSCSPRDLFKLDSLVQVRQFTIYQNNTPSGLFKQHRFNWSNVFTPFDLRRGSKSSYGSGSSRLLDVLFMTSIYCVLQEHFGELFFHILENFNTSFKAFMWWKKKMSRAEKVPNLVTTLNALS